MQIYADSHNYRFTLHQSDRHLPYLLMLHGFMGSGRVFDHLLDDLTTFCNPITLDLAGHGKTKSPTDSNEYSAQKQTMQLQSVIRRLQFENLWLYGYSMGGRLSFQLITSHPELFSGAIIESSHCGIKSEDERLKRKKLDEERARQIETNFEGFIEEWIDLPLFRQTPQKFRSVYKEIMQQQNPESIAASLRGFGAGVMPFVCGQVQRLRVPLTLITGELDHKYLKMMADFNKRFDSSNIQIVKEAGHRVHTDKPNKLIDILKNAIVEN